MPDQNGFLVAIDNRLFFCEKAPNGITGTRVPSAAQRFDTYTEADSMCQGLRRQGYIMSLVTDSLGNPIDIDALKNMNGPVYVVRFGKSFYSGRDRSGKVVGTDLYPVAKKLHYSVAQEIVKNLDELGYSAFVDRLKDESSREQDDIDNPRASDEYREAWGEPDPAAAK